LRQRFVGQPIRDAHFFDPAARPEEISEDNAVHEKDGDGAPQSQVKMDQKNVLLEWVASVKEKRPEPYANGCEHGEGKQNRERAERARHGGESTGCMIGSSFRFTNASRFFSPDPIIAPLLGRATVNPPGDLN